MRRLAVVLACVAGAALGGMPAGRVAARASGAAVPAQGGEKLPMPTNDKAAGVIAEARELFSSGKISEAEERFRAALAIDSRNHDAQLFLHLIPTYDRNSPDSDIRVTSNFTKDTAVPRDSTLNQDVDAALGREFIEVTANEQRIEKILLYIADNMNLHIAVNWAALADAGVRRDTPVSVSLKNTSVAKTLTTILGKLGESKTKIGFIAEDGAILVSTREELDSPKYQSTATFDINDILSTVAKFPRLAASGAEPPALDLSKARQQLIDDLTQRIIESVGPDSWITKGGKVGTIREADGKLIITQTHENLRAIQKMMMEVREKRVPNVEIEVRALLVPRDFLEGLPAAWNAAGASTQRGAESAGSASIPAVRFRTSLIRAEVLAARRSNFQGAAVLDLATPYFTLFEKTEAMVTCVPSRPFITGYTPQKDPAPFQLADFGLANVGMSLSLHSGISAQHDATEVGGKLTLRTLARMDHAPAPNVPAASGLLIDRPVLTAVEHDFSLAIPNQMSLLMDAGAVPADFFRNTPLPPDTDAPKGELELLLLLDPRIHLNSGATPAGK